MGCYEEVKKIGQKIFTSWSLAAMFLILLIAAASPAGDVSLKIDGTDQPDPADLAAAITASNTHANGAGQYATAIEITLTGAQTANSGTANTINPLYFLHGSHNANDPTNGFNGFKSVSLVGSGSQITIGFSDSATNRNRVLEIINVKDAITVENVKVTGGHLTHTGGTTYLGGGGMYLGGAAATKYPNGATVAPTAITVKGTLVSDNKVELITAGNDARAAIGGGAFIDGTKYDVGGDTAGSVVVFENVGFDKNAVSVTSTSGAKTGSSSFGGGVRIKNAAEFTYTTGTISNNTATTTYGSHAAGGGIAIDDYTKKATLSKLTISGNQAIADQLGAPAGGISKALGGGLYTYYQHASGGQLDLGVSETTFQKNIAEAKGASVDAYGGGAYLNVDTKGTFSGVTFKENEAKSADGNTWGAGLAQTSALDLAISGSEFTANKATAKAYAKGGAIFSQGKLTADQVKIDKNEVSGQFAHGGGIYAEGAVDIKNESLVSGNTLKATDYATGGGVHAEGTLSVAKTAISENIIEAGADGGQGGGIYTDVGAAATISESEITGNVIKDGNASHGGGIYANHTLSLSQSKVSGNEVAGKTDGYGGGLYARGAATVTGTTFADNKITATDTGWGGGIAVHQDGSANITGGAISGNTVSSKLAYGGGIYAQGATTLTDIGITKNAVTGGTQGQGGGVYVDANAGSSGILNLAATSGKPLKSAATPPMTRPAASTSAAAPSAWPAS